MAQTNRKLLSFVLAGLLGSLMPIGAPARAQSSQADDQPSTHAAQSDQANAGQSNADQAEQEAKQEKKEAKKQQKAEAAAQLPAALWHDPGDIASLDLLDGAGGASDAPDPDADYQFVKEDMNGTSPKFYVRDPKGVEWLVKSGVEAKPETAATRLVWATGYFTDEDYHLPKIHVVGLIKLHRHIRNASIKTGMVPNVRLKRESADNKKVENWNWAKNPFSGTRELHGLLVMMALINNWDLKDPNNKIYVVDGGRHYLVSDLGASFGKTGVPGAPSPFNLHIATKGSLKDYEHSKFIRSVKAGSVGLEMDIVAPLYLMPFNPGFFRMYAQAGHLEDDIPLADVEWIGGELAQLRPQQIRDAFTAAGYRPEQVDGFAKVVERRIAQLNRLQDSGTERALKDGARGTSAP